LLIPQALLNTISAEDLAVAICGKKNIDFELL